MSAELKFFPLQELLSDRYNSHLHQFLSDYKTSDPPIQQKYIEIREHMCYCVYRIEADFLLERNNMDNINRLGQLIIRYRENMAYYHDIKNAYNETECRDEYISPLLECFGWDVRNAKGKLPQYKEVVVERFSNSGERPDYTLTLNGVSKIFVEAKKPSVDITIEIEPAMQIRKYGWNAKHALAILTNFEDLLVYDTTGKPKAGETAVSSLYRRYHFDQYVEKYQEIADLISQDSVYSGHFDEIIQTDFQNDSRYTTQIDHTFLQHINRWRMEIGEHLYESSNKYQDISLLNDMVQDFINQIIFLRIKG